MLTKTTISAIFVIAIAVALVTAGGFATSASAAKTRIHGTISNNQNTQGTSNNKGGIQGTDTGNGPNDNSNNNNNNGFNGQLNQLSDCLTNAVSGGSLSRQNFDKCYDQIFLQQPQDQQQQQQLPTQGVQQQQQPMPQQQPQRLRPAQGM